LSCCFYLLLIRYINRKWLLVSLLSIYYCYLNDIINNVIVNVIIDVNSDSNSNVNHYCQTLFTHHIINHININNINMNTL